VPKKPVLFYPLFTMVMFPGGQRSGAFGGLTCLQGEGVGKKKKKGTGKRVVRLWIEKRELFLKEWGLFCVLSHIN